MHKKQNTMKQWHAELILTTFRQQLQHLTIIIYDINYNQLTDYSYGAQVNVTVVFCQMESE